MVKGIQKQAHVYGPKTVFHIFTEDNASIFFAAGRW